MEIGVRLLGAYQLLMSFLMWPYYYVLSCLPHQRVPRLESSILTLSATELAKKIRNRELTSTEVVKAYVKRIRTVNPIINAVVEDRFQDAIEDAIKVDKYLESTTDEDIEIKTPLLGVPFTVKESCGLKGLSQCGGCLPRKGTKASDDGESVQLMKKAGAIPLCVTNTPELCLCWESNNLVTGCTKNPYNTARTAGGSSGGEGAIIGAGASVIGIGSDIGGSIRIPSLFNGIFGHKPTPGFVSLRNHFPWCSDETFSKFLVIGPMARYAEDLKLLLNIMTGGAKELNLDKEVDVKELNVFYKEDAGYSLVSVPVSLEIKKLMKEAAEYLNNCGCSVQKGDFEELENSVEISGSVLLGVEGIPNVLDYSTNKNKEDQNLYVEVFKAYLGLSEFSFAGIMFMLLLKHNLMIPRSKYSYYRKINDDLKQKFKDTLKDNGVLLYPTFPLPALYHNQIFSKTAGVMYSLIFNTLELPCTHVPLGLGKDGLPLGIQVVAGPKQDRLCLAVAQALEKKFGGWVPHV